jgi:hypothetical protein
MSPEAEALMPNCWLIWDTLERPYINAPYLTYWTQSADLMRNIKAFSIFYEAKGYHCGRHD